MSTRAAAEGRAEMIRRLRLGNLRKLLRDRCGPTLPDDDAGREYLHELLLPISAGPHAAVKMPNVIEVWAPWMKPDEAAQLVDDIMRTPIWRRMPAARALGQRLNLGTGERERLKLWTIAACDMNPAQALEWRKRKARARMRLLRQLCGSKPHATSAARLKPWMREGISRRTWYRRHGTNSCALMLTKAENELVPPQQVQLPKGGLSEQTAGSKAETTTKAEKPDRRKTHVPCSTIDRQMNARISATEMSARINLAGNGWWRNAKTADEKLGPDDIRNDPKPHMR